MAAALCAAGAVPMIGAYHDDGIYVATARGLAEGRGYVIPCLPGAPPQTKFPPLWPVVLSLVARVAPHDAELPFIVPSILMAGLALGTTYLWLVRRGHTSRAAALLGCVVVGTSTHWLYFGELALTEMPYAALTILACWRLEREIEHDTDAPARSLVTGIVLALPFSCRSMGAAVLVGGALALVASRPRRLPALVAGACMVAAPWLAWTRIVAETFAADSVLGYYVDYGGWWASSLSGLGTVAATNAGLVPWSVAWVSLSGLAAVVPSWSLGFACVAILVGLGSIVALVTHLRGSPVLASVWLLHLLLIVVVPWPPPRFVAPLAPVLVAVWADTCMRVLDRARWQGRLRRVVPVLCLVFVTLNLVDASRTIAAARVRRYPVGDLQADVAARAPFDALFEWIRTHTAPTDVIGAVLDPMIWVYTGRSAIRPFQDRPLALFYGDDRPPLGTAPEMAHALRTRHATWVATTPLSGFAQRDAFDALVQEGSSGPAAFLRREYVDPDDPRFAVYRVVAGP